jgi:hypothetical protein
MNASIYFNSPLYFNCVLMDNCTTYQVQVSSYGLYFWRQRQKHDAIAEQALSPSPFLVHFTGQEVLHPLNYTYAVRNEWHCRVIPSFPLTPDVISDHQRSPHLGNQGLATKSKVNTIWAASHHVPTVQNKKLAFCTRHARRGVLVDGPGYFCCNGSISLRHHLMKTVNLQGSRRICQHEPTGGTFCRHLHG